MEAMVPLYAENEARRWDRRARACLAVGVGSLVLCLAACAALCAGIRPTQAVRRLYLIIGLNTLGGWILILTTGLGYRPARAECRHLKYLENGETAGYEGALSTDAAAPDIPGGIRVAGIRLAGEDGQSVRLRLNARKRRLLPPDGTLIRVRCRGNYVTAFEVCHEAR